MNNNNNNVVSASVEVRLRTGLNLVLLCTCGGISPRLSQEDLTETTQGGGLVGVFERLGWKVTMDGAKTTALCPRCVSEEGVREHPVTNTKTERANAPCEDVEGHEEHPLKNGDVLLVCRDRIGLPSTFARKYPYLQTNTVLRVLGCCSRLMREPFGEKAEWRHFLGIDPMDEGIHLQRGLEFEVIREAGEMWLERAGASVAVRVTKVAYRSETARSLRPTQD